MLVGAIVVTFNRQALLERCVRAIAAQSRVPGRTIIVDNASTDGTGAWLAQWLPVHFPSAQVVLLSDNVGGAGGFAAGMQAALESGCDWVWMMDDDAEPRPDALERLLSRPLDPKNVYSSLAVAGTKLAWPLVSATRHSTGVVTDPDALPPVFESASVAFLGILISATTIRKVGLPDCRYFFQFDDVEYCLRCRDAGAKIMVVTDSRIDHPPADRYELRLRGRSLGVYRMPPWKRYYHVRNRIFLAKRYYGWSAYYKTAPTSFLRLFATLRHEPCRCGQTWATIAGVVDGVLGRGGGRHASWGLQP